MKIRVRYFAQLREIMGCSEEWVETEAPDVAGLRRQLMDRGAHEAEVAFFPPVTGG